MARRMRVLALVVVGAGASACTVLAGLTEDYRVADGSTPSAEGGNVDPDGARADGSLPDGGADALPDQLAADGGRFCDTVAKLNADDLCDDFEEAPLGIGTPPKWSRLQNGDGAVVQVATGGKDGTRGLDINGTIADTMHSRNVFLVKTLPKAFNPETYLTYDIELDFMVVESGADYLAVGVLNFTSLVVEDYGVAVYPADDVIGRLTPKTTGVPSAFGVWHHAHISLSHKLAGTPFDRKTTIDGESGAAIVDTSSGFSAIGASATELRMGTFSTGYGAGRVHAVFDNVVARRTR